MTTTAIVWYRRDLRVHDHPALRAALDGFDRVVPAFVLDDALLRGRYASGSRTAFMLGCLRALDGELRARGGGLLHHPESATAELQERYRGTLQWGDDAALLRAWQEGRTGFRLARRPTGGWGRFAWPSRRAQACPTATPTAATTMPPSVTCTSELASDTCR
jgi:deoxyribodipyrimidine photolyase